MFERFTDPARRSVGLAQEEARRMGHGWIGTEHLLLGLLDVPDDVAARALQAFDLDAGRARAEVVRLVGLGTSGRGTDDAAALRTLGIDLEEVRRAVEAEFGPGALDRRPATCRRGPSGVVSGRVPFAPRAKKVLELSLREAVRMRDGSIGTQHILLGLVREGEGVAMRILSSRGASAGAVRSVVRAELRRARPDAS